MAILVTLYLNWKLGLSEISKDFAEQDLVVDARIVLQTNTPYTVALKFQCLDPSYVCFSE